MSILFLPPQNIGNDVDILKKLITASRALAGVNSNIWRLPNPYMLINTIAIPETMSP